MGTYSSPRSEVSSDTPNRNPNSFPRHQGRGVPIPLARPHGALMHPNTLMTVLDLLHKDVDDQIQIQTLRCLLYVASRGQCSQKDLEQSLGMTNASASRNISYWTERRFDRKAGKGFIERSEDEFDRRFKSLTLTRKGKAFMQKLREI